MDIKNRTNKILSDDIEELLNKTAEDHNIKLSDEVIVEDINNQGLVEAVVEYQGQIDLEGTSENPAGNPELYSTTLGDVYLLGFSDGELRLQVYDRL